MVLGPQGRRSLGRGPGPRFAPAAATRLGGPPRQRPVQERAPVAERREPLALIVLADAVGDLDRDRAYPNERLPALFFGAELIRRTFAGHAPLLAPVKHVVLLELVGEQ